MNKYIQQNEKGLTLVEVVVATLLLSIGILTALTLLSTGITVNAINRDKTKAMNIAEQYMEMWKYRDLTDMSDIGHSGYSTTNPPDDDQYPFTEGKYDVKVILNPASEPPPDPTKFVTVQVNVSWQQSGPKDVEMVTVRQFERN